MIGTLAIALVMSTVLALAVVLSIPALQRWLDRRRSNEWVDLHRSNEPDGSRTVATDSAFEAERKRLADLKAELAAAETRTAERERQLSVELGKLTAAQRERSEAAELAKQEAAMAQRVRILERSLADAERRAAEATARIEAREAALANQEAGLQPQKSEPAAEDWSAAERDLTRTRAVPSSDEEGLGTVDSDWWEKQLGRPLSAEK